METTAELSYGELRAKSWALDFLDGLLEEPLVSQSGLQDLIMESAEKAFLTSFTDDSDYAPNVIGLMELKKHWNGNPTKREAITRCLDKFYYGPRTNWIVQECVKDLAKEIGLIDRYKQGVMLAS